MFFEFESDFVESLRCIPMVVRYKLDRSGVKLKLQHWHGFDTTDRQGLVDQPCENEAETAAYRDYVRSLVVAQTNQPPGDLPIDDPLPWETPEPPAEVVAQAAIDHVAITPAQWSSLSSLQRFALFKLSRSGHENRNFTPAAREFGLLP